jgi:hypothetical protein
MDDDDNKDVIRRLFALLTAKMEDGGAIAVEGQAPDIGSARADHLANRIHSIGLVTDLCRSPISLCHLGFEREGLMPPKYECRRRVL